MSFQHFSLKLDENGKPVWSNRRATVRYQCAPATPGKVYADSDEQFLRAWVLDLSKTGAGLVVNRPLKGEAIVTIQITSPADGDKYEFPARVAHSTQQVSGDWMIGVEFLCPLSADQLELLL